MKYKPGKQNALADALSRRPDYELAHLTTLSSSISDLIRAAYAHDTNCVALLRALGSEEFKDSDIQLSARLRARLHRYSIDNGLLCYCTEKRIFLESWFLIVDGHRFSTSISNRDRSNPNHLFSLVFTT